MSQPLVLPTGSPHLGPAERVHALAGLQANELDILIIGGGVVGCGAALDAASRGLRVGLIEQRDWAAGTSSRSSRLAHGGLRYLEQFEFGLVREALTERGLLLERLAPHLVRPVPFVFPLSKSWERPYVGAGVALYDALSRVGGYTDRLKGHKHLSQDAVLDLVPALRRDAVAGGVGFFDAQIDDVRHTLALARQAAAFGAHVVTRVEATVLTRGVDGRVTGAELADLESGRQLSVRARVVIGSVGVWSDRLRALLHGDGAPPAPVRPSKGVHLIVPKSAIDSRSAIIARTEQSVLFLLPWGSHWIIGTTDTPWDGDRAEPEATEADVEYLLEQANNWLVRPISWDDIVGVYAGLRPLIAGSSAHAAPGTDSAAASAPTEDTTKLSREHAVSRSAPGLVTIAGGKYTTYRVMARDVVDAAVADLAPREGAFAASAVPASATENIPCAGGADYRAALDQVAWTAADAGLPELTVRRLLTRHGDLVAPVLELIAADRALAVPLHPESKYLRAEIVHAATHEGALHLEDVLARRTRLALMTRDGGSSVAKEAAELMGAVLGWDGTTAAAEVAAFEEYLSHTRGVLQRHVARR